MRRSEAEVDQTVVFPNVSADEFLREAVLASQRNQVVEVAERHAGAAVAPESCCKIAHRLHGCGDANAGFEPLLRSSIMGPLMTLAVSVHEERDGLHVGTRFASVVSLCRHRP